MADVTILVNLAHFSLFLTVVLIKSVKTFDDARNIFIEVLTHVLFSGSVYIPATNLNRLVKHITRKTSIFLILIDAMIPDMYKQFTYVKGRGHYYLEENLILGPPRLRQIRLKNGTCEVYTDFEPYYPRCYDEYSPENEDKTTYFGTKYATMSELDVVNLEGKVHDYPSGGYVVQLTYDLNESLDILKKLRDDSWLDKASRLLILEMSIFNWRTRLFGSVKYLMELMPAGGMVKSVQMQTVSFNSTVTNPNYFRQVFLTVLFLMFVLEHIISSIRNLFILKKYVSFYSWARFLLIFLFIAVFFYDYWHSYYARILMQSYRENPDKYLSVDILAARNNDISTVYAIIVFIMSIQILRVLTFDKSLLPLYITVKSAVKDTISFSFMFMIIFVAYTFMGQNLFGTRSADFALFGYAAFNIMKTMAAEYDYGDIEEKFPVFGPIYFICNILLFFIILMNMFLSLFGNEVPNLGTQNTRLDLGQLFTSMIKLPSRCIKNCLPKCIRKCKKKISAERRNRADTNIPNSGFFLEGEGDVSSKIYGLVAKPKIFMELLALKISLLDDELKRILERYEALDKTFKLVNGHIENIMKQNSKHRNKNEEDDDDDDDVERQ